MLVPLLALRLDRFLHDPQVEEGREGDGLELERHHHVEVVTVELLLRAVGEDGHVGDGELVLILADEDPVAGLPGH
jgi:hypothetical protein